MTVPWVPAPGELVKDTHLGKVGEAVAWDGKTGMVTLTSLSGEGLWETDAFGPANDLDELRALIVKAGQR